MDKRLEKDLLGTRELAPELPWGIHTERARENFPRVGGCVNPRLLRAYVQVKQACAEANGQLGYLSPVQSSVLISICKDIDALELTLCQAELSALQGGAGTSTNMLLNEVLGLRAACHPLEQVNLHQSTNDTYPTALKLATIFALRELSTGLAQLQGGFQKLEKNFAHLPIMGSTEMVDAVPFTLGLQFSSFAEAFARDRWRTFKAEERLRTINLGGTAIGTGLTAPRAYIFLVVEKLREITGLGLARAENMVDQTANVDGFVEVSGICCATATNLMKVALDLRNLASRGTIKLPPVQAGSSIMPGKVNPVILESVVQMGIKAKANHSIVMDCAAMGSLQICEYMPLLAEALLENLELLLAAVKMLNLHILGIEADAQLCQKKFDNSKEIVTAFLPLLGYEKCQEILQQYEQEVHSSFREYLYLHIDRAIVDKVLSSQSLMALGYS
jgi:aspartate ammonia-lyase